MNRIKYYISPFLFVENAIQAIHVKGFQLSVWEYITSKIIWFNVKAGEIYVHRLWSKTYLSCLVCFFFEKLYFTITIDLFSVVPCVMNLTNSNSFWLGNNGTGITRNFLWTNESKCTQPQRGSFSLIFKIKQKVPNELSSISRSNTHSADRIGISRSNICSNDQISISRSSIWSADLFSISRSNTRSRYSNSIYRLNIRSRETKSIYRSYIWSQETNPICRSNIRSWDTKLILR